MPRTARRFARILLPAAVVICAGLPITARLLPGSNGAHASGYLHTDGARIVNVDGGVVRLTGINWFGLETCTFAPHGLWSRNWRDLMAQIRDLGFNTIRLPFSSQLLDPGSTPSSIDYDLNPDLRGLTGLQIMDKVVGEARVLGLKVILDRHRPVCGAQSPLWYTDHYSEARWIADWVMLARRYAGNDAVIGADLHNEPHERATWGDGNPATDWLLAAERAGNAILRANPNWLIIVEGIEHNGPSDYYWWGGNLAAAGAAPVRLAVPHRLVYETHDYGPEIWGQRWFNDPEFPDNLPALWDRHWGYLARQGIAPVLVGEFGGVNVTSGKEGAWIHALIGYIRAHGLSYTYWCMNPDSGDTGGLLQDDWKTVNPAKLALLRTDMAPLIGSPQQEPAAGTAAQPPAGATPALTDTPPPPPTPGYAGTIPAGATGAAATSMHLSVQYMDGRPTPVSNNPSPNLRLLNAGPAPVRLADLQARYHFRASGVGVASLVLDVDWSSAGAANVQGSFVHLGGDRFYVQVGFTPAAGQIPPGGMVEIKMRIHKRDWSTFDQRSDYSFGPPTDYTPWPRVPLFWRGRRVWGTAPS
jgi:endoglucanase